MTSPKKLTIKALDEYIDTQSVLFATNETMEFRVALHRNNKKPKFIVIESATKKEHLFLSKSEAVKFFNKKE